MFLYVAKSKFNAKFFSWVCQVTITYLLSYLPNYAGPHQSSQWPLPTPSPRPFAYKMSTRFWEVGNDDYIGTYLLIYLPTCWALAMAGN